MPCVHKPQAPGNRLFFPGQRLSPCPRMRFEVDLTQAIHRHEGVDLCGRHRGMPEQLLDYPHVGAALQQMGGIAVP